MIVTDQLKTEIYQEYHTKVRRYLYGQVNNAYLSEDLCSDVFLKVYEKLDTFDEKKASLSTWIYTITRNTLTDYYRSRKVHEEIPETLADEDSVDEDLCNEETLKELAAVLRRLDERERDIIVLHYYSGLTLKATAERMGISYAYVKILHNKALTFLKENL